MVRWTATVSLPISGCMFLAIAMIGCVPSRKPVYLDEQFARQPLGTIVLLPLVDARKDKSTSETHVQAVASRLIPRYVAAQGYTVIVEDRYTTGPQPAAAEVAEMTPKEWAILGPAYAKAVMLFFIEDVCTDYKVVAKTWKVEASAVLIEKPSGRILWKDKVVNTMGILGPFSGLYALEEAMLDDTLAYISMTLPKR